jgi:WD40 repeat protein
MMTRMTSIIRRDSSDIIRCFDVCRHQDIVFDMLSVNHLSLLASASLDTSVRVWDTYLGKERLCLQGHKKGVFSLAYNPQVREGAIGGEEGAAMDDIPIRIRTSSITTNPIIKTRMIHFPRPSMSPS